MVSRIGRYKGNAAKEAVASPVAHSQLSWSLNQFKQNSRKKTREGSVGHGKQQGKELGTATDYS